VLLISKRSNEDCPELYLKLQLAPRSKHSPSRL